MAADNRCVYRRADTVVSPTETYGVWNFLFDTEQHLYEQLDRAGCCIYLYRVCDVLEVQRTSLVGPHQPLNCTILKLILPGGSPLAPGETRTAAERAQMRAFVLRLAGAISDAEYLALYPDESATPALH